MQAALTTVAVVEQEAFRPASTHPWSLVQGDADCNFQQLRDAVVDAAEQTASNIQHLLMRSPD